MIQLGDDLQRTKLLPQPRRKGAASLTFPVRPGGCFFAWSQLSHNGAQLQSLLHQELTVLLCEPTVPGTSPHSRAVATVLAPG